MTALQIATASYYRRKRRREDAFDGVAFAPSPPPALDEVDTTNDGSGLIGDLFTATVSGVSGMDAPGARLEFRWVREDGALLSTGISYRPTEDDAGQTITLYCEPRLGDQVGTVREVTFTPG